MVWCPFISTHFRHKRVLAETRFQDQVSGDVLQSNMDGSASFMHYERSARICERREDVCPRDRLLLKCILYCVRFRRVQTAKEGHPRRQVHKSLESIRWLGYLKNHQNSWHADVSTRYLGMNTRYCDICQMKLATKYPFYFEYNLNPAIHYPFQYKITQLLNWIN